MLDFFGKIVDMISRFWDILVNVIKSLALSVVVISQSSGAAAGLIPYLPTILASSLSIVIAVSIVKLITGR